MFTQMIIIIIIAIIVYPIFFSENRVDLIEKKLEERLKSMNLSKMKTNGILKNIIPTQSKTNISLYLGELIS